VSAAARLAAFALVLAAVFVAAAAVGSAVGPFERSVAVHGDEMPAEEPHEEEPGGHAETGPAGLSIAEDGLRLEPRSTVLEAGGPRQFEFTILHDEEPLLEYDLTHERELHLIVVRRDLGTFLHLHPERRPDGTWSTTLELPTGGAYRAFADFSTGGTKHTLGVDLLVPGEAPPPSGPAASRTALVEGYRVTLEPERRRAGEETAMRFGVTRDGREVAVDEYLGARGHLVVLRAGDLAYLHTHAEEDELRFETTFPSAGRYRAFLQLSVDGAVRTAVFDLEVGP
jgi:hypothetical protein